jgi:hypothetical protein
MTRESRNDCPECAEGLNRREFVRAVGAAAVTSSLLLPRGGAGRVLAAGAKPSPDAPAETAARRLYESLSDEQRKTLCFAYDDPLRKRINANWAITKGTIDDLTKEQQELAREVFKGVTSPDGYERFMKQMDDDYGGFEQYHIALFGKPGSGGFEWELTGRHMTIRADGDSAAGAAFGGPIVYGHGAGDSQKGLPGNVFYYQTQKANEVFNALDGGQRKQALVAKAPAENAVDLQGQGGKFPGIRIGELSADQKELVEKVMRVVLAPYREADVDEAMAVLKAGGGLDGLHMAFYESDNIGDDQEWDIWRLEGPTFVWHFRGAPHVHAYVNVAHKP